MFPERPQTECRYPAHGFVCSQLPVSPAEIFAARERKNRAQLRTRTGARIGNRIQFLSPWTNRTYGTHRIEIKRNPGALIFVPIGVHSWLADFLFSRFAQAI